MTAKTKAKSKDEDTDNIFEGVELAESSYSAPERPRYTIPAGDKDNIVLPDPSSVDWNGAIMALFTEDELVDGRPIVSGLRRVAELVIGPIQHSGPIKVFPSTSGTEMGRVTVISQVSFRNGSSFTEVADCWEHNTDDMFCAFATATASTRALGRALRQALRLKTVAAEEMTNKDTAKIARSMAATPTTTTGDYNEKDRMTTNQKNFIDIKCKAANINVSLLFKEVYDIADGKLITKAQASTAIDQLNVYQQDASTIPAGIVGYTK